MAHYLMASSGNSPTYMQLRDEAKGRPLPNPSVLPPSNGNGCAFSPDGSRLAVAHNGSPSIAIYDTADWSKLPNPSVLPASDGNGCAFSPDGSRLAVVHNTSPFITIYNTADWSSRPASLFASGGQKHVAFSAVGKLVVRGSVRDIDNNPAARRVRVHERSTGDLCAETTSSAVAGEYEVAVYQGDVDYDVQFLTADGEQLNDLIFARTRAGTP